MWRPPRAKALTALRVSVATGSSASRSGETQRSSASLRTLERDRVANSAGRSSDRGPQSVAAGEMIREALREHALLDQELLPMLRTSLIPLPVVHPGRGIPHGEAERMGPLRSAAPFSGVLQVGCERAGQLPEMPHQLALAAASQQQAPRLADKSSRGGHLHRRAASRTRRPFSGTAERESATVLSQRA